ncbi:MAG: hypothetical protein OEY05_12670 [Paracoccaceae bacterium]|nr:hypothetical protein [Paracoccaceae bacterium]MDH5530881.1 hypothetical protein [Paracoccaceae bacterium]
MSLRLLVCGTVAFFLTTFPAHADLKLVCQITDYRQGKVTGINVSAGSDLRLDIKSRVPPKATHLIRGSESNVEETGKSGTVENNGTTLQLHYTDSAPFFGTMNITYTYRFSDKSISVMMMTEGRKNAVPIGPVKGRCEEYW